MNEMYKEDTSKNASTEISTFFCLSVHFYKRDYFSLIRNDEYF